MDRSVFFNEIRPTFGGRLMGAQVQGMEALLDEAKAEGLSAQHIANVLAQTKRETGAYMSPIKETVQIYHSDKNPSDAVVKARLEKAWNEGRLGNVTVPYWRDGWFGRGQIQISHKGNYEKLGEAIGVDLVANPDKALELPISAKIAVVGMSRGLFTGKKLSDYAFPAALDAAPKNNPRRIVNGRDGSDKEVAKDHKAFYAALVKAGWDDPVPEEKPATPQRTRSVILAEIKALIAELESIGG